VNLANLIEDGIRRYGEYDYCYFEGKWWTNTELNETANRLGNALKKLGVGRGDRVVTQLPNCVEIFAAFNAVFKIGAAIVPMNPVLRPDQISYIYRDSGACVAITTSDYLPWIMEARKNAPGLKHIILVDKGDVPDTLHLEKLLSRASSDLKAEDMENDDLAALVYTSGTTGNPKGVMHTHYSLWINALAYNDANITYLPTTLRSAQRELNVRKYTMEERFQEVTGLDRNNPYLAVLPLSHSYGLGYMNFGNLAGARFIIMRWWNPEEALRLIEKFRITLITFVPTMYWHILESPNFDKYDLSSLRYCACGAAAMSPEVAKKWKEKTGLDIQEGWGMTESGAITSGNAPLRTPKIGSIGFSMLACNRISVVDEEDRELGTGQTGELVIKGPTIMKGYWNMPEETAETLKNGWLHTGDIGYRDEDGYFYITDRKKDLIIRGGENVSPREVEDAVCKHPAVAEAACVGYSDRVYGEEIKAFVVLKQGEVCSEADIVEFCRQHLPTYKQPKRVQFIDAIPKNMLGKTLRAELRKLDSK
jgi:long-chain acyl-CoA synthetase